MMNAVKDFERALKERTDELEKTIDEKIKAEMKDGFTIMTMRLSQHENKLFTTRLMNEYEKNGFEISFMNPDPRDKLQVKFGERLLRIKWNKLEDDKQHA